MLSPTLLKAINEQITHEINNNHVYQALTAYFVTKSLDGFVGFMKKQACGENEHAQKLIDYVHEHHDMVQIGAIEAPSTNYATALEVFQAALALEKGTTEKLKNLYILAAKENDFATQATLDWFMTEQVEEETTIQKVIDKLEGVGSYMGLLMIDESLS